jgi:hydroxymethylpyrimidine/phosphomethylpyrimidine kinase
MDRCTHFALTIAGSDSGGGAGIQADLRAFHSQGVFGLCAITAITAQNSTTVSDVLSVPTTMIAAQVGAVASDFPIGAIKTGMLANAETVLEVTRLLKVQSAPTVVDPVMVASSGARLLDPDAESALRSHLIPMATVLTPNLPEAAALLGIAEDRLGSLDRAAQQLRDSFGADAVLLKGGHAPGAEVVDIYCDAHGIRHFRSPRLNFRGHGTGCSLAALIAARLALGEPTATAVANALSVFRPAVAEGYVVGSAGVLVPNPRRLKGER